MVAQSNKLAVIAVSAFFIVLLIGFIVVAANSQGRLANSETFSGLPAADGYGVPDSVATHSPVNPDAPASGFGGLAASDPTGNEVFNQVAASPEGAAGLPHGPGCYPRDRLTAEDLLPKDAANTKWAQMNPAGQGDVADINLLNAGYHVGVMTHSTRNANLQLRSEPPNPTVPVSVFNISTIAPGTLRKELEIGS